MDLARFEYVQQHDVAVAGAEPPAGGGEQLIQPGAGVCPTPAIYRLPNCQVL